MNTEPANDQPAAADPESEGNERISMEAVCGLCRFHIEFTVKAGPGAIGQQRNHTECRRFPPAMMPVLGLPVDALMQGMAVVQQGMRPGIIGASAGPQQRPVVIMQPAGGAPAYPPTPPDFPACGEFQPKPELLGGGSSFVNPEDSA